MTSASTRRCLIALAAFALMAGPVSCSADGEVETRAADASEDASAAAADGCGGTDLEFINYEIGVFGRVMTALATDELGGGIYVAHAADFDIDADALSTWRPEVPAGNNVITIQMTMYNAEEAPDPVEEGATLRWTSEPGELTYVVRHFTTDDDWSGFEVVGDAVDEVGGEMTVTGVGETFCFEIDYRDPQKTVSGTVDATVIVRGEQ